MRKNTILKKSLDYISCSGFKEKEVGKNLEQNIAQKQMLYHKGDPRGICLDRRVKAKQSLKLFRSTAHSYKANEWTNNLMI